VHSPGRARSQFFDDFFMDGGVWRVRVVKLAVFACVLRTTTKKGHQIFEEESACTPRKSWLRLWLWKPTWTKWQLARLASSLIHMFSSFDTVHECDERTDGQQSGAEKWTVTEMVAPLVMKTTRFSNSFITF